MLLVSGLASLWHRTTAPAPAAPPVVVDDPAVKQVFKPDQLDFKTVTGKVTSILPEDKRGLPHQRFMLQEDEASGGLLLEVDVDTKFGQAVPDLAVGEALTIRGKLYHDEPRGSRPALDGIHWTHHKDVPDDAGFVRTPDGKVYQ